MKISVGRRRSKVEPNLEGLEVVVYLRWPWQKDRFYNEGNIGVEVSATNGLMITMPSDIISYAPGAWRRVASKHLHP